MGEGADDAARLRGLRRMKTLALSLLVFAALVYLLTRDRDGLLGYVNAGAEAAMVGAIADWFAVTAIFRHPLRLPIPHTAIIPKRKESLGASLQEFVAENFLREDVVRERIATTQVAARAGGWLVDGDHARRLVDIGARVVSDGLGRIKESDVAALVEEAIIPRMLDEELSPMAGQLLGEIVRDGAHIGAVDLALTELHRWLSANEEEVTSLVGQRAPGGRRSGSTTGCRPASTPNSSSGSPRSATPRTIKPVRPSTAGSPSWPTTSSTTRPPSSAPSGSRSGC
jgi:uncharacterized membrane-anchored protein YjiN (DUF445 family)